MTATAKFFRLEAVPDRCRVGGSHVSLIARAWSLNFLHTHGIPSLVTNAIVYHERGGF